MARKITPREISSKTIAVIGEGITETYYLLSVQELVNRKIMPTIPQHSQGLEYLKKKITECLDNGYSKIYCLIDMDVHSKGAEKQKYEAFKQKYNSKPGVIFIENYPCIEIWFYYYFKYSTSCYSSYENENQLKSDLLKIIPEYEKKAKFFKSCNGLHSFFINKKKGDFKAALVNSYNSIKERSTGGCGAYSEMKLFFHDVLKEKYRKQE